MLYVYVCTYLLVQEQQLKGQYSKHTLRITPLQVIATAASAKREDMLVLVWVCMCYQIFRVQFMILLLTSGFAIGKVALAVALKQITNGSTATTWTTHTLHKYYISQIQRVRVILKAFCKADVFRYDDIQTCLHKLWEGT